VGGGLAGIAAGGRADRGRGREAGAVYGTLLIVSRDMAVVTCDVELEHCFGMVVGRYSYGTVG
jgi:hypothetical protein